MFACAAGSLDAYCNMNFGYQCMDKVLDPQCPGLFRQNNVWMASTDKTQLCDPDCLKALCRLQEQAKTSVTCGCCTARLAAECWQTAGLQATVAHT